MEKNLLFSVFPNENFVDLSLYDKDTMIGISPEIITRDRVSFTYFDALIDSHIPSCSQGYNYRCSWQDSLLIP